MAAKETAQNILCNGAISLSVQRLYTGDSSRNKSKIVEHKLSAVNLPGILPCNSLHVLAVKSYAGVSNYYLATGNL